MYLEMIRQLSIIKTIAFNVRYFGLLGGGVKPRFLVARNMKLQCLKGKIIINSSEVGTVMLGFRYSGLIDKNDRGIWDNRGIVEFKGKAQIGSGTRIINSGCIVFGDEFKVNGRSTIICSESVSFGRCCLLSWDTLVMDNDWHNIINLEGKSNKKIVPIELGEHVWVASNTMILKGAKILSNSVCAAGSIISRPMSKGNVLIGDINRQIKEISGWK